ncbi:zinc finger protein ZFP2-like [Vanessa tameamea]|uniref:Zinc finger protein ZFP2-like n=1 Tax=Vanessa tameamea TaxID=334116 RepID=A0ABM4AXT3_VANTA
MSRLNLRKRTRISYYEPEEPNLDEYVFCTDCGDFVYEYCAIHKPLLVIPDDKVPSKSPYPPSVPRSALTIPRVFLHLAPSVIPGAGIGVFSTLTLPRGVRFGPYRGKKTDAVTSMYSWQIHDGNNRRSHFVDAEDAHNSNWMRFVNCSRHWNEQNLVAYQYKGQLYYRTIKIIPKFTELMVFYGSEFANILQINLKKYNSPVGYAQKLGAPIPQKSILEEKNRNKNLNVDKENALKETKPQFSIKDVKLNDHIINKIQNNKFICDVCSYETTKISYLITHLRLHNGFLGKIYACNFCKYISFQKYSLNLHIRTHTGEKPYECHSCHKKFSRKAHLEVHIRTHTGEKPYECHSCHKKFSQKAHLEVHIRTHTGEKPYECHSCHKKFNTKTQLNIHIRTHTGEKPYECHSCHKKFNTKTQLNIHIRTHTGEKPYECHSCHKKFNTKTQLNIHIRTHTGEKPYECHSCHKKFSQITYLKLHIRTHTGEKPYECHSCHKKFNTKTKLNIHIRTHTGEKPYERPISQK